MTWLNFISKKSLWFSKGRIHGGGVKAKVDPSSLVRAHSNRAGCGGAGRKELGPRIYGEK